ncbi:MAG: DUF3373 domain-containing protein [Proteobacteria bacterium]|nr:DUF3373 domain-containing protein [Pseudomonadota bacterium]MBU1715565.1 DUF3373 domain-containing protein [Pseudomonadota bacterium]
MVKKFSTLILVGLLAAPMAASAAPTTDELAERLDTLEEKSEGWDLASRISLAGDIRTRADYHTAKTAEYYKATDVAIGVTTFTKAQPVMAGIVSSMAAADTNGDGSADYKDVTIGTMIGALGPMMVDSNGVPDLATWRTNLAGFGSPFTAGQEEALFYMMTNQEVGGMLTGMASMSSANIIDAMQTPQALASFMKNLSPAARAAIFTNMGYGPTAAKTYKNDTLYSTRLRLDMRAKATENVEVKVRLVGYKVWGMQDSATPETNEDGVHDTDSPYFLNSRSFDGTSGRQPGDNKLVVDRAFMNWNAIAGQDIWFSIGRRPTTDGPPAQLRMGADKKMATPVNYMDYPFDGLSLGYAYQNLFGIQDAPGRVRFCYGRGFEAGPNEEDTGMSDVDFGGISWDIYQKGNKSLIFQTFGAFNLFNVPGDTYFPNPLEEADKKLTEEAGGTYVGNTYLDRKNMGNLYHTSAVYMDKVENINLNWFLAAGWSRTDPKGTDELGVSLLNAWWNEEEAKDGYSAYLGVRYDMDDLGLKLGAEYNYGSENWLGMTPGHDDMYSGKLSTRGSVYELYAIYNLPSGEAVSQFGKAFMRLGYQHYDYEYTYSGMWLGVPEKISDINKDPLSGQFYAQIDEMDNVYLTFEAWF